MTNSIESQRPPAIDEDLAKELGQYKGRWVAVDEGKNIVVGVGDTAVAAVEAARKAGCTDPLVFRVPTNTRRVRIR